MQEYYSTYTKFIDAQYAFDNAAAAYRNEPTSENRQALQHAESIIHISYQSYIGCKAAYDQLIINCRAKHS